MEEPRILSQIEVFDRIRQEVPTGPKRRAGPPEPLYVEIHGDDGLFLFAAGAGNDQRFAAVFRAAWLRIPAADRETIVRLWRTDDFYSLVLADQGWSPRITLEEHWPAEGNKPRNEASNEGGHVLRFKPSVVDAHLDVRDDEYVQTLVAHEVAHTLDKARGSWGGRSPDRDLPYEQQRAIVEKATGLRDQRLNDFLLTMGMSVPSYLDCLADEERVHAILRDWGFNPDIIG